MKWPSELQTISGLPSPVMSVKCGDSLSVIAKAVRFFQWPGLPFGFSYHGDSAPGKPSTRTSSHSSPLRS